MAAETSWYRYGKKLRHCYVTLCIHIATRQTRQNCLVCVVSASAVWIGFPATQESQTETCQTVSRLISHCLTRHRQDRLVVSGGRCELGIDTWMGWGRRESRGIRGFSAWCKLALRESRGGMKEIGLYLRDFRGCEIQNVKSDSAWAETTSLLIH